MWNKYPKRGEQRDSKRILIILEKIKEAWAASPDLRLIQLLWVIDAISHTRDGFSTEDRDLETLLDKFIEDQNNKTH